MKKIIFLGLLMVLGLSFAQPPPPTSGLEWSVFRQTTCQGVSAWVQTVGVEGMLPFSESTPYYVWSDDCYVPEMPFKDYEVCYEVCYIEGVWWYYDWVYGMCGENPATPECQSAKREFYAVAKQARGMFATTQAAQLSFARQALFASKYHGCDTSPEDVTNVIMFSNMIYRECMAQDPESFFGMLEEFCSICMPDA